MRAFNSVQTLSKSEYQPFKDMFLQMESDSTFLFAVTDLIMIKCNDFIIIFSLILCPRGNSGWENRMTNVCVCKQWLLQMWCDYMIISYGQTNAVLMLYINMIILTD